MSRIAPRLAEEPGRVLRLQAFRGAHPEIISRYTLRGLLDKPNTLTGGAAAGQVDWLPSATVRTAASCVEQVADHSGGGPATLIAHAE
jgi:hypothetical protein